MSISSAFKLCISVERMDNLHMSSTRKSDVLEKVEMLQSHQKKEEFGVNKSNYNQDLQEDSKMAKIKRRNHWLDLLSSVYFPINPISVPRYYGKRSKK